ncbi:hypothetical protein [Bradyrhizobium sp. CCBAU 65884]|uniref:hypothetical protein n=1 Tax=Bradyrhizobium sp. CCBAU 65884 TaxID=722477 RepID=UPI002304D809|nr:hypothetical protein [Bradyrhizobium sp. CCBAU 65884]
MSAYQSPQREPDASVDILCALKGRISLEVSVRPGGDDWAAKSAMKPHLNDRRDCVSLKICCEARWLAKKLD